MLNSKGIAFIQQRVRPTAINTVSQAAEAIGKVIAERDARIASKKPLTTDSDPVKVGLHIAWIVALDHLFEDRSEIHHIVEKLNV